MNGLKDGWFSELSTLWPGVCLSLQVDKVLHSEKSEFQEIMVLQTKSHGKALILDGIIQCTESDEFSYQEMISFLPLCSHPAPKKVLIVGGGDGGVAREVAKHPVVESIHQVEIDEKVMKVSKTYLPFMGKGLTHPKLTVHVADGFKFMAQHRQEFDIIITDSSDPETNFKEPLRIFTEEELNSMLLRYYSPEIHRAAFVLPRFADKALYSQTANNM